MPYHMQALYTCSLGAPVLRPGRRGRGRRVTDVRGTCRLEDGRRRPSSTYSLRAVGRSCWQALGAAAAAAAAAVTYAATPYINYA